MRTLLAHPGTQHARRLAWELEKRHLLDSFWTGFALAEDGALGRSVSRWRTSWPFKQLHNRVVPGVPSTRLRCVPWNEFYALARLRLGADSVATLHARNASFQRAIPAAAFERSQAVIGFDTSSWILAERAARHHRPFFLDRTIGHPQALPRIMASVARRYPQWIQEDPIRSPEVEAAEQREHELAHRIVVGSPFVAETLRLAGVASAKIVVNPYGVDWPQFAAPSPTATDARPLRFLFAGSLTARKGLPILLEAWQALRPANAELWLAGWAGDRERALIPDLPGLRLLGQLPHREMAAVYAQCDVFVLPTLFEGFSLVVLEALAAGLPVITTANSGAGDILTQAERGRLIEPGSSEALIAAMGHYLGSPPSRAAVQAATAPLQSTLNWHAYGDRWAALLNEVS